MVGKTIWDTIAQRDASVDGAKHLQESFIEMTDVFLLGTGLVIVAFGLYPLFLEPGLPVPAWLRSRDLDQLTAKLVEVVGVGVGATVLVFGVAVALVIAALSALLIVSHRLHGGGDPPRVD